MKLIVVRHGESIGNTKQGFISGRTDPEGLTLKGRSQIIRTAWELRNEKVDKLITSPVKRAKETAEILNTYFSADLIEDNLFTELHHGLMEGHYWWEVIDKIPASWRENREDFASVYPGGGESMQLLVERVWEGLQKLLKESKQDGTTVIVTHHAIVTALRHCLINGNPEKLKTKKQIDTFLQFMHSSRFPNGGIFLTEIKNGKAEEITDIVTFEPLKETPESAEFYFRGQLNTQHDLTIETVETASANAVFHIQNEGAHLLKVLHEKDVDSVVNQEKLYKYLQKQSIPVPTIELVDTSTIFFKDPILVQDYVEGEDQRSCQINHPAKMKELFVQLFSLVNKIHTIPVSEVKDFWFLQTDKQFLDWKPFMLLNINLTIHYIPLMDLTNSQQDFLVNILSKLKAHIQNEEYKVVPLHGDLATGNIIISHKNDQCELQRIIDFEQARIGDPLWDYVYYWGWIERISKNIAETWKDIIMKNMTESEKTVLNWYRILFHAWTVRDLIEYKGSYIREKRGKASLEILRSSIE